MKLNILIKQIVFLLMFSSLSSCLIFKGYSKRQLEGKFTTHIPYKVVDGWIVINTEVGGKKGDFIFDTGAKSVVFSDFDSTLIGAYPVVFNARVIDAHNQKGSVNRKYYSTILGNIAMDNHQWLISTRLSFLSTECKSDTIQGLLGNDVLNQGVFYFNHADSNLTIYGDLNQIKELNTFTKVKISMKRGYFYTKMDGVNYLIDSGSSDGFLKSSNPKSISKNLPIDTISYLSGAFLGVSEKMELFQKKEVHVNGLNFKGIISFNKQNRNLLGAQWFLENDIIMDATSKRFYIRKGKSESKSTDFARISLTVYNNYVCVYAIKGKNNQVSIGDKVLEINGVSTESIKTDCDLLEFKKANPISKINTICIDKNGKKVCVEL